MTTEAEFRKQVKEALEHLYDTTYLASHSLLPQLIPPTHAGQLTRAQKLRSCLKEALEAIRPQADLPGYRERPEWRCYLALRYRYVQGMGLAQVENELGLSLRQLQRELRKGLNAITLLLWEARLANVGQHEAGNMSTPGEIQALSDEMEGWRLAREVCEVQSLLDAAQWMLRSVRQNDLNLRLDLPPSLAPVWVDATLMRQALFQILRLLTQQAGEGEFEVSAAARGNSIEIMLRPPDPAVNLSAADWQTAQLLIERQGGALSAPGSDQPWVTINLPQASPIQVLMVDDNQAIHELFERYLAPHFYKLVHAYNGVEALRLAQETQPDIIILDVMMPTLDGWQVLRNLAENPATAGIPVVVCSVLNESELALSLGARAYIKKPADRLELLATLAKLQAATPANGAAPAGAIPPTTPAEN